MATGDRRDHLLHQHVQSERDDRRRPPRPQGGGKGLSVKPWVKTSLAPGSQVVGEYLSKSGLQKDLDKLGFNLVGFGCTTCIGNSGPLPSEISKAINENDLVAAAVLSGNRNFEGRVNADVRANYLASPPLVVLRDRRLDADRLAKAPLGTDAKGRKVYLRDIWPTSREINAFIRKNINKKMFTRKYGDVFKGDAHWRKISVQGALTYPWDSESTYVQNPPYFAGMSRRPEAPTDVVDARVLGLFLEFDHHRSHLARGLDQGGFSGRKYLIDHHVKPIDFNQYGTRRGNHEVMMRGTFAISGSRTKWCRRRGRLHGALSVRRAHDDLRRGHALQDRARAARGVRRQGIRHRLLARLGGQGHDLLGVRAVIAQSFERIHRSNLVGMGVVPLVFEEGTSWQALGLKGDEQVTIRGLHSDLKPHQRLVAEIVVPMAV